MLRYRGTSRLLRTLGLFDIYHSPWYLALLGILLLNALVCTIQRLLRLWHLITRPPKIVRPDQFYQGFAHQAEWPVPGLEQGVAAAQAWLRRRRYRVHIQAPAPAAQAYVFAEHGRWAQLGYIVTHASAIVLVVAVAARPAFLWMERGVFLLPGQDYVVERTVPFTVRSGELTIERTSDGHPRDYSVPLTLLRGGAPVLTQTVRINHPFSHNRVAFHLEGYGPGARLETPHRTHYLVLGDSGVKELPLPETDLRLRLAHRPEGNTLFVQVLSADGTLLGSGLVANGKEIEVRGLPITLSLSPYTTWQVSQDPTFLPALVAALFLLLGITASLWVPHRKLWLRIDGHSARMVGTVDAPLGLALSFDALASEMASRGASTTEASNLRPLAAPVKRDDVSDA
jgi:cytochrome c biogenesis protein